MYLPPDGLKWCFYTELNLLIRIHPLLFKGLVPLKRYVKITETKLALPLRAWHRFGPLISHVAEKSLEYDPRLHGGASYKVHNMLLSAVICRVSAHWVLKFLELKRGGFVTTCQWTPCHI